MFNKPDNPQALETLRMIEAGGLPPEATRRLMDNAQRQSRGDHIFTSNLSVNELLLTHECGYEPLAQVMGTSVYHVGWQFFPGQTWGPRNPISGLPLSQEMSVLTEANFEARNLAFGRLIQEAQLVRADGVVGVRFERINGNLPEGTLEFKAVGTAVRQRGVPPSINVVPFLSNLSGQDHWALRKAGLKPIGFVFGNCSWYQVSSWRNTSIEMSSWGSYANKELPDFTQAVYQSRELAMQRLGADAMRFHAEGVVGVTVEPEIQLIDIDTNNSGGRRDLLAQFTVYGTAIATEVGGRQPLKIQSTIPLTDS